MSSGSGMRDRMFHWLLGLYPRGWRERYGDELLALIETRTPSLAWVLDIVRGAARERLKQAFQSMFGESREEHGRHLRRYARLGVAQVMAAAAAAMASACSDLWLKGSSAPIMRSSTWTSGFAVMFLLGVIEVTAVAYLLGAGTLWFRRKLAPYAATHESWLLTILLGLVVGVLASGPPQTVWSEHLQPINSALATGNMLWMLVAQTALPAGLSVIRPTRAPSRVPGQPRG